MTMAEQSAGLFVLEWIRDGMSVGMPLDEAAADALLMAVREKRGNELLLELIPEVVAIWRSRQAPQEPKPQAIRPAADAPKKTMPLPKMLRVEAMRLREWDVAYPSTAWDRAAQLLDAEAERLAKTAVEA